MRLRPDHFAELNHQIYATTLLLGPEFTANYVMKRCDGADRVRDANRRYRWDLFWLTPFQWRDAFLTEVYTYCDDTHLDTALRSIVPLLPEARPFPKNEVES